MTVAVSATTHPTLLDYASRADADGGIAQIIEVLDQVNPLIDYIPWLECNNGTSHKTTSRTGIPAATWRRLNAGVQPSKSTTRQTKHGTGMLEQYAEVDMALAELNGNTEAWRISEERPHIEGLNQEFISTWFNGDETLAEEEFTGLNAFYNSTTAENGQNILKSGTTPNVSMWLLSFGPNTLHGIYPKGGTMGIRRTDKGQVTIEDADGSGGRMEAYRTHYRWDCGLALRDWRYCVRIQLDYSELVKNAATGPDLIDLMAQAHELVPNLNNRPVWVAPRAVKSFLRRQIANKVASSTLTMDMVGGKRVMAFEGVPVERCDALLYNETAIS